MPVFTAVVHDADGVRFVAAAHAWRELEAQVVDYIGERCDYVLWPRAAANVRELIARDSKCAAIAAYFANVGQRWDPERLELLDGDVLRAVDWRAAGAPIMALGERVVAMRGHRARTPGCFLTRQTGSHDVDR